ncbi:MAG TPA: hypothetical protein VK790_11150 [Solirubrobacteraceae bacterium]|jgi:hypothetical protein|nr:hypothetical protein [Solirubrobacteraceae bacterium]
MRSIKLTVAIVAAAASLMLASAAASARVAHERHAHRHGAGCHVTLNVAPRLVTSGESVLAFGRLRCASAGEEANQTVTLYQSSVTAPGFGVAGTTTTDVNGYYQVTASDLTTNSVFYVTAGTAQSGHRGVRVAAQVTLSGPPEGVVPTSLRTGRHNSVTFTGAVSPADGGAMVVLQRQNAIKGNEWHRIGFGVVSKEGSFTIPHTFVVAGDANIRVVVRSGKRNVASPSNVLGYEIVQAQNPQLTIESSANPISYGQTATISGTVAGAANASVQLLARSAQTAGFTQVGEAKTDGSGHYTFAPQTPLVSTFYRVQGTGKKSAVLYEGVKYVLTAGASATTVQSGQALTFSGTVTPDETGHVIYLERENAAGTGFHVIEVGTVSAGSTYSIAHTFYNVGTSVVRIKIPGGPLNGTTDSTPFTITVTPTPSASLLPEAPGNSTQPPEGQV